MIAFGNFLRAQRYKSLANGAQFVFRDIIGGVANIVQTKLRTTDGGGVVPPFDISIDANGLYSTSSNGFGFYLPLDHQAFDSDYAAWQATLNIEPVLSPESISNGATLSDLTNATAADQNNISAINTLKAILSMG